MKIFRPLTGLEGNDPREIAQQCWDIIEPRILDDPAPWLWAYKHWRYLPPEDARGDVAYPAYANRSKRFDDLLQGPGESADG